MFPYILYVLVFDKFVKKNLMKRFYLIPFVFLSITFNAQYSLSQIGKRFPSEKKVIIDPVTKSKLVFLTSGDYNDSKIYQTHNQWTSDSKWIIFRSDRVQGEAMAVNEETGEIVQVTEGGYTGMLNVARKSMKLYFMRNVPTEEDKIFKNKDIPRDSMIAMYRSGRFNRIKHAVQIIEVDLALLFNDSKTGKLKSADVYQKVCGTIPAEIEAGGDMALDGDEKWVYFRVGKDEAKKHLPENAVIEGNFGPRNMGAGPSGIGSMNIETGEIRYVVSTPFQIGHIQTNPWMPGEIVFCWETGGKSPQRTWIVRSDGSGLRPLYKETSHDWVTHEAIITKDEVAIAILGHRQIKKTEQNTIDTLPDIMKLGQEPSWGDCGTREYATGLGIINIRTKEMTIAGQTDSGSGFWHVNGSSDGRWAVGDDFARNIYIIDCKSREMTLLSTGHKPTASDHPHPTFSPDNKKVEIQSSMLSKDEKSMDICVIHIPEKLLKNK
jgi:oligogalacturonide lyase